MPSTLVDDIVSRKPTPVWRFGLVVEQRVVLHQQSYSTPGPVSTGMGDRAPGSTPGAASHPGQLSLAIPLWVGAVSTSQRPVMVCSWGVKAGMVRERVVGKTM